MPGGTEVNSWRFGVVRLWRAIGQFGCQGAASIDQGLREIGRRTRIVSQLPQGSRAFTAMGWSGAASGARCWPGAKDRIVR